MFQGIQVPGPPDHQSRTACSAYAIQSGTGRSGANLAGGAYSGPAAHPTGCEQRPTFVQHAARIPPVMRPSFLGRSLRCDWTAVIEKAEEAAGGQH